MEYVKKTIVSKSQIPYCHSEKRQIGIICCENAGCKHYKFCGFKNDHVIGD